MKEIEEGDGFGNMKVMLDEIVRLEMENSDLKNRIDLMRNCGNCFKSAQYADRKDCPLDNVNFCDKWEF